MKPYATRRAFQEIKEQTCEEFRIDVALFDSPSRISVATATRKLAWWRARRAHQVTFAQLAEWSGNRDTSTVWHNVRSLEAWMQGKEFSHGVRKREHALAYWRAKKAKENGND